MKIAISSRAAINNYSETHDVLESSAREEALDTVTHLLTVLGLEAELEKNIGDKSAAISSLMDLIVDLRRKMRKRKDWEMSELASSGREETAEGTR